MKTILITISIFCFPLLCTSQAFNMAAGGKLGTPIGVTFKKFISETDAIDLSAGFSSRGVGSSIGAMLQYQRHADLEFEEIENFQWYYGAAASAFYWRFFGTNGMYFGGHFAAGLSYTFEDYPVNLSVETNPGLYVGVGDNVYYNSIFLSYNFSLCARYILPQE